MSTVNCVAVTARDKSDARKMTASEMSSTLAGDGSLSPPPNDVRQGRA